MYMYLQYVQVKYIVCEKVHVLYMYTLYELIHSPVERNVICSEVKSHKLGGLYLLIRNYPGFLL